MNFFKQTCMTCPVASDLVLGRLKYSVNKKKLEQSVILFIINLLLFLSVRYGKYGTMIVIEALATCFVQARIARRQAKS